MLIKIADINITGGTQPRENIDMAIVAEYAEAMELGAKFPPVVVFHDGAQIWLAEGFHRVHATTRVGYEDIDADVRQGTRRDAILHAVGSNVDHGRRRTNDDKRKAVKMLLNDPDASNDEHNNPWSDSEIARRCHVDPKTVASIRESFTMEFHSEGQQRTYTTKHGTVATMNTANIGRKKGGAASVVCEANMPITDGDEGDDCGADESGKSVSRNIMGREFGVVPIGQCDPEFASAHKDMILAIKHARQKNWATISKEDAAHHIRQLIALVLQ